MTASLAHVGGKIVDAEMAKVPLLDRGHLLGDGVFETLRTHQGHVVHLDAHERRMREGLEVIGLREDVAEEAMGAVLQMVAAGMPRFGPELHLRVQVTTGVSEHFWGDRDTWSVTGLVRRLEPAPAEHRDPGVRLVQAPQRKTIKDPLSRFKSTSFAGHLAARRFARSANAEDAVLLNDHGRVAEASTSNLFAVVDGRLHSPGPEEGAVDGTVRQALLEAGFGIEVERALTVEQFRAASEAFLTNSIQGVLPVRGFHAVELASARGPVTSKAVDLYRGMLGS